MDLDNIKKVNRGSESFRETAEKQLENLNAFIKAEYLRQQVPEDKIPVITGEMFSSLRDDKTYESAARETPHQTEIRRREFLKGLGMSAIAGVLAAKGGTMVAASLFKERLSKLQVAPEEVEKYDSKELEDRARQIALIIVPGALLAAIPTVLLTGRLALRNQTMLKEINLSRTNFALVMFSVIFNIEPAKLFSMSDSEIEEKLRTLKRSGCDLEDMIMQHNYASLAEHVKEQRDRDEKGRNET